MLRYILKDLRKKKGLTQEALASILGLERSTIGKYEGTKQVKPSPDVLIQIGKYFNVSTDYLLGLTDDPSPFPQAGNIEFSFDNIFPIEISSIPLLGEIACGEPIFTEQSFDGYVYAGSDIHADFCLKCKGDSMIGARILDGDVVFIRRQPTVENGEIAAVIINNEATLKRVIYYPDRNMVILKAENQQYKDLVYVGEELNEIRIIGKAVAFQSDVR